jgi:hypothetical protein
MRSFGNLPFRKRIVAIVALVVALVALAAGSAYASFTATVASGGNGGSSSDSLPRGSTPGVSLSGANVTVSFSQSTVGGKLLGAYTDGGYTVKRYPASGGSSVTPGTSCDTTISGPSEKLSCTESNVPPGSWKYTVTPMLNNWVGAESAQSAAVTVIGPPARLAFTPATPGPGTAGEAIPNVAVSVEDSAGNVVTSQSSGSVTISIESGGPQSSFTSGTTTASVSKGVASFTNLVVDTSGSYTFTATPSSIGGVTSAVNSGAFTVSSAALSSFTLSPSTSTPTAGTAFTVGLTALDQFGNTVTSYTGAQCITFSGPANSPNGTAPTYPARGTCSSGSAITFSNGVATGTNVANITLVAATKPATVTLTATDNPSGKKGASSLTVSAGAAHGLAFTNCAVSTGGLVTCSASGEASTVSVKKKSSTAGGTWTAKVGLIDQDGNEATASGAIAATVSFTTVTGKSNTASITYSSGTSLAITSGASQSSNTFTFQPTTNGAMSPYGTVTASSTGLSSISATVNTI